MNKGVVITPDDLIGVDWPAEMKKLGLNTLGIHSGEGIGVSVRERLGQTYSPEFRRAVAAQGVQVEYELHAGSSLLPRDLFETQPDCFTFDRRLNCRSKAHNWCPSSPEAQRIVGENAKSLASLLKPDTHRYFFWGDDARGWCHCKKCRHMTDADQELMAANVMAKALLEVDPLAQVAFLAYGTSFAKPTQVKPLDNVFVEYAPIQRCYQHPLNDTKCGVNRDCWKVLKSLAKVFPPERIHVLEYWLDSSMASKGKKPAVKPFFVKDVVRADLAAYTGLGIRSITTFAVFMDGAYFAAYGRQDLDTYAELINEFLP